MVFGNTQETYHFELGWSIGNVALIKVFNTALTAAEVHDETADPFQDTTTPEPATWALFAAGAAGLGWLRKRNAWICSFPVIPELGRQRPGFFGSAAPQRLMHVRDVMIAMPRIHREHLVQTDSAVVHIHLFRMHQSSAPLRFRHAPQQTRPAGVQRLQQLQRNLDWRGHHIAQPPPRRLVVGLDQRLVVRQRQFEPHVAVHVAVGNMMNDLANRPSSFPVRRIKLSVTQP